ncbi:C45 family peptidase [Conexibacter stalactiti]|uniref:C45 family peptidase n=1 Tax=Conexibacter stalactiti TaxID=1940611 RepID=A0ABU4HYY4_9ACTN|nr:C45 family peptidase [Conexibacter stalactiti]MDW5598425.1 C45 family peptidase [Conexibacter stalactiti]MEC5039067.1 C45 family peptidase [Conexibacter stalactiti]
MSATLTEHDLGGLPWLVARGDRQQAFRQLGARFAEQIAALAGAMSDLPLTVRRRAAAPRRFDAIAAASRRDHPLAWTELEQLAAGAGVSFESLLLLNLRGDAGLDPLGCTDVLWSDGERLLFGHNEDGDPALAGRCALLTLALDDDPVSTSWWYPGFLPGNTFALNEHGLAWGLDNVNIPAPAECGGRGFVARSLQASCRTLADAAAFLARTPSAGGFAYSFADTRGGERLLVEAAAGRAREAPAAPLTWHTNHLLLLDEVADRPSAESRGRAAALAALELPRRPAREWLLALLAGAPVPAGVHRDGSGGDSSATLCTFVADVPAGEALVVPLGAPAFALGLDDFAHGNATGARPLEPSPATAPTDVNP